MQYKDPGVQKFTGKMIDAGGGGVFVKFPGDVQKLYGTKGRVPVKIVFDGKVDYQGSLANMGEGHCVIVLKNIREQLGKQPGDEISIQVSLDSAPRVVQVPPMLKQELAKHPAAQAYFNSLAYSHQKEYVNYILEAKQEETKIRRLHKTIEMLQANLKIS